VTPFVPDLGPPLEYLEEQERIHIDGPRYYTSKLYTEEAGVAGHVRRVLREAPGPAKLGTIDLGGLTLSEEQKKAVETVFTHGMTVITGGPGTGKTTMVRAIVEHARSLGLSMGLAAPTGRAAKRLSEAAGRKASTIHRLLVYEPDDGGFAHNVLNPLGDDLLIIDEASMVDLSLMYSLIQAVKPGARLVMVGDINQLPSVGPGEVLKSCITSGKVPTVRLTHIYRQAQQSAIVRVSYDILKGRQVQHGEGEDGNGDCYFIPQDEPEKVVDIVKRLVKERIPAKYKLDPMSDIQVLVPMHKGTLGTQRFNQELQNLLNPNGFAWKRSFREWRVGDKVMQTKNNYEHDVFNGDIGIITEVNLKSEWLKIRYEDDREVQWSFENLAQMTHAYTISIHKSQGSEYPAVILPMHPQFSIMLQRKLLYTAVTRAKAVAIIVGSERALNLAISNNMEKKRNTVLHDRIRKETRNGRL